MYGRKSLGSRMEPLSSSSFNWLFLWRLPILNYSKLSFTEKRQNKAKYLTQNSIRLKFVKKTSMPNLVKSLRCTKCYSLCSPRPIKTLAILSDTTVSGSAVDWEDLKPYWKSEICHIFSKWSASLLFTSFSKTFTNRSFPNIFKYRDHQWDLSTIWKTRLLQTHIEVLRLTVLKNHH